MPDPPFNPYAPPAEPPALVPAELAGVLLREGGRSSYEGERRNVAYLLLLCIVTMGFYPSFWFVRRAPFLDSVDADRKLGGLPWLSVAACVMLVVFSFSQDRDAIQIARLIESAISLFLAFRTARILRSDFARTGRTVGVSSLGVFFFGCLYLQHVMNEAADEPARPARAAAEPDPA
jgi:hypothetical protein